MRKLVALEHEIYKKSKMSHVKFETSVVHKNPDKKILLQLNFKKQQIFNLDQSSSEMQLYNQVLQKSNLL